MSPSETHQGPTGKLLCSGPFWGMYGDFKTWRMDDFQERLRKAKGKSGQILSFVRGLRLSAQLVYAIRQLVIQHGLTADWGHILDDGGEYVSNECDVIIYKKDHFLHRWNGYDGSIMDFKFIEKSEALVVVSCKSYIQTGTVDEKYCEAMKPYIDKIWLFAECCGPKSGEKIRQKALEFGYEYFWYLYDWSKSKDSKPNIDGWNHFVDTVKNIAENS